MMKQCQVSERSAVFIGDRRDNLRRVEFFCTSAVAANFRKCWSLVRAPLRASNQSGRVPWCSLRPVFLDRRGPHDLYNWPRCDVGQNTWHKHLRTLPLYVHLIRRRKTSALACGLCSRPNASLGRILFDTGSVELRGRPSEPTTYETRTLCGRGSRLNLLSVTRKKSFHLRGSPIRIDPKRRTMWSTCSALCH